MTQRWRPRWGAGGLTEAYQGRAQARVLQQTERWGQGSRDAPLRHRSRPHRFDGPPARFGFAALCIGR
jgi:hypothetical protein